MAQRRRQEGLGLMSKKDSILHQRYTVNSKRRNKAHLGFTKELNPLTRDTARAKAMLKATKPSNKNTKRDMLYFVRDMVQRYRLFKAIDMDKHNDFAANTHQFANMMARDIQYFNVEMLDEYLVNNVEEMYPMNNVLPPNEKVRLPAPMVGLYSPFAPYVDEKDGSDSKPEVLIICTPDIEGDERTRFKVHILHRDLNFPLDIFYDTTKVQIPKYAGVIDSKNKEWLLPYDQETKQGITSYNLLRITAAYLQTINKPRLVKTGKAAYSQMKKMNAKKSLKTFIADSWNKVSWNVDEPVEAKSYEEGRGGRQALHYRRGFYRRALPHWEGAEIIDGLWRIYIEGYEAGHPAFGVKKSYHLPRIKGENKK